MWEFAGRLPSATACPSTPRVQVQQEHYSAMKPTTPRADTGTSATDPGRSRHWRERIPAVDRTIQELHLRLDAGHPWLRFPPSLEALYQAAYHDKRRAPDLWTHGLSLLCYLAFLLVDKAFAPQSFALALRVRLSLAAVLIVGFFGVRLLKPDSPRARELFLALAATACGLSLVYLASVQVANSLPAGLMLCGLPLVIMFMTTLHRVRWWTAVAVSLVLGLGMIGYLYTAGGLSAQINLAVAMLVGGSIVFSLVGSYRSEYEERTLYLLRRLDRAQREREGELLRKLGELSERYQALSLVDALTGMSNRRHLHEFLDELWPRAAREGSEIAMLLIDVDHFKDYNDTYGHPAGDRCLQALAGALRQTLRNGGDLVARFGGEEFVVVLPGSSLAMAADVARRIQTAVAALGISHVASPVAQTLTISIGISAMRPGYGGVTQDALISAADTALYQAKTAGRNCIRTSDDDPQRNDTGVVMLADYRMLKR